MPDSKWTYPDGSSVTDHEDGSVTVTDANGAKSHYDPTKEEMTETPAPGADGKPGTPTTTKATKAKTDKGEVEIRFQLNGLRVYIRLNPRRIRIVRSAPHKPRKIEIDLTNGQKQVQEDENGPITPTAPKSATPDKVDPSEHPKKSDKDADKDKDKDSKKDKGGNKDKGAESKKPKKKVRRAKPKKGRR